MNTALVSQPGSSIAAPQPAEIRSKRKREPEVLDEDEWTSQIEAIIERDFFPDLPKLQNKLEWLQVLPSSGTACLLSTSLSLSGSVAAFKYQTSLACLPEVSFYRAYVLCVVALLSLWGGALGEGSLGLCHLSHQDLSCQAQ